MKFGQVFNEALRNGDFPQEWLDSAVSYSQLKKCIKRLRAELNEVGLDPETLQKLLKQVEHKNALAGEEEEDHNRPLEYILSDGNEDKQTSGSRKTAKAFHPKLIFYVDEVTGALHDAKLDAATKQILQKLAIEADMLGKDGEGSTRDNTPLEQFPVNSSTDNQSTKLQHRSSRPGYHIISIPLTSDTEFFTKLNHSLSSLEALQTQEEQRLQSEISTLGSQISHLTDPDRRRANRKLLSVWRQTFQMYIEEAIFFGTTEQDHSAHDTAKAAERWRSFCAHVDQAGVSKRLNHKANVKALRTFMHINLEILQGLRFDEINRTATLKILKKFDKRTALTPTSHSSHPFLPTPDHARHLARTTCAALTTHVLSHVPSLADYSCPTCMELKWRPVRLRCGHDFCIRCLIVMQTQRQHRCPLCRQATVAVANSENLDMEMAKFLKKWFPEEVKEKQKYNELMAGVDQYGEVYQEKCVVM